jgi:hypothetical protein
MMCQLIWCLPHCLLATAQVRRCSYCGNQQLLLRYVLQLPLLLLLLLLVLLWPMMVHVKWCHAHWVTWQQEAALLHRAQQRKFVCQR